MGISCVIHLYRKVKRRVTCRLFTLNISNIQACIGGIFIITLLMICVVNYELIRTEFGEKFATDINKWRLSHLTNVCQRLNNGGHTNLQPAFYLHSKNYSLVYCPVFKAGTSTWFYNFNTWAGFTEYEIMHNDNLFLARKFYPIENRVTLMQSMAHSFSFIIVRHPFERLISAFEDRLVSMKNAYYSRVSLAIYRRYHPTGSGKITFRDFVQYIIDDVEYRNSTMGLDIHWSPVNNLCTPCLARYDYIIKLETYEQDVEVMIKAAKLQGKVKLMQLNHVRKEPVEILIMKYFSQITQKQIEMLYSIYEIDFQLFGYSADKYFQIPKSLT
ncbi:carbohydrate sulfotransferase 8-like [Anopheles merus]|uniref:carbohydrate sulfotransferase 8-like n=1 Tax=Anopheles merus TaxID=30066 RepID=UPI001BE48A1A|nr:carbohydrate sulfotransferase 8-like [Anopheles merus]